MLAANPLDPDELAGFVINLELTGYLPLGSLSCLTLLRAKAELSPRDHERDRATTS